MREVAVDKLRRKLAEELGDALVGVDVGEFWDGSNVRVYVRRLTPEIVERAIRAVRRAEHRLSIPEPLVVDVVEHR